MGESGHRSAFEDGSTAFDNKGGTYWRPQCKPCNKNEAWLTFTTTEKAKCITAKNLGYGSNSWGFYGWNNGIVVELRTFNGSWRSVMESNEGNSAFLGIDLNLPYPKYY